MSQFMQITRHLVIQRDYKITIYNEICFDGFRTSIAMGIFISLIQSYNETAFVLNGLMKNVFIDLRLRTPFKF